jgi:hypothetical protein
MTETLTAETQGPCGARLLEVRIAQACALGPVPATPDALVANLQAQVPELDLAYATARTGWHRLGGVVDADYRPLARDIEVWAEQVADGDLDRLLDHCTELHGFATRLEGRTHYLTAVTGERAADFIQIEIEELQEVIHRPLWTPDWLPDDLTDFCDPLEFPRLEPELIGPPRLLVRRLVRVPELLASADAGPRIKRFFADWDRSSAGESACFCERWILSIREYQDASRAGRMSAKPIAILSGEEGELPDEAVGRGAILANLIHAFDRRCGYHFAWYFHMLTRRRVSYQLAESVHADLMGAFDYLPAKDLAVLRDWHKEPYSL